MGFFLSDPEYPLCAQLPSQTQLLLISLLSSISGSRPSEVSFPLLSDFAMCLSWDLSEAETGTKIQVQAVCLGDHAKKYQQGSGAGKLGKKRKRLRGLLPSWLLLWGPRAQSPWETLGSSTSHARDIPEMRHEETGIGSHQMLVTLGKSYFLRRLWHFRLSLQVRNLFLPAFGQRTQICRSVRRYLQGAQVSAKGIGLGGLRTASDMVCNPWPKLKTLEVSLASFHSPAITSHKIPIILLKNVSPYSLPLH